jgi:hypothetical protein
MADKRRTANVDAWAMKDPLSSSSVSSSEDSAALLDSCSEVTEQPPDCPNSVTSIPSGSRFAGFDYRGNILLSSFWMK